MKHEEKVFKLIPKVGPNEAQSLLGKSGRWLNFARRVQHNPDMKAHLHAVQRGACPVCDLGLEGNLTIHHVSYMNRCLHDEPVLIPTPTSGRPHRTAKAPPCNGCPKMDKCASYLSLVHSRCHVVIHTLERQMKGS